jgi:hypothetical protein
MTMENIPYGDRAGIAGIESASYTQVPLFSGDFDVVTQSEAVDTAVVVAALPQFTPMSFQAAGAGIAPSVVGDGLPFAGITTAPYDPAVSTMHKIPLFKTGIFNPAALNWDASFDTDAKKAALFHGLSAIFLRAIGSPAS